MSGPSPSPSTQVAVPTGPIVLVGMRAVGKSSVGRVLGRRLQRPFIDLDLETLDWGRRLGAQATCVGELFVEVGELVFRSHEAHVLRRVLEGGCDVVLATGAGAVERADNRAWLRRAAVVLWLRAPLALLAGRLAADETFRPALLGESAALELEQILARRAGWYGEVSQHQLDVQGKQPEELAEEAERVLCAVSSSG